MKCAWIKAGNNGLIVDKMFIVRCIIIKGSVGRRIWFGWMALIRVSVSKYATESVIYRA